MKKFNVTLTFSTEMTYFDVEANSVEEAIEKVQSWDYDMCQLLDNLGETGCFVSEIDEK